jgi:hypothetical protein
MQAIDGISFCSEPISTILDGYKGSFSREGGWGEKGPGEIGRKAPCYGTYIFLKRGVVL